VSINPGLVDAFGVFAPLVVGVALVMISGLVALAALLVLRLADDASIPKPERIRQAVSIVTVMTVSILVLIAPIGLLMMAGDAAARLAVPAGIAVAWTLVVARVARRLRRAD